MVFVMGSSCYLQTPISNSQMLFSSSQSLLFNVKNAEAKRRRRSLTMRPPMASLNPEDPDNNVSSKRRAVLLVGISILPFLRLRAAQAEASTLRRERQRKSIKDGEAEGTTELPMAVASEGSEVKKPEENKIAESTVNKPEGNQIAESELNKSEENPKGEELKRDSSPFLSLLNGLGIFGAGVLGAFYALARKEKKVADETIESMKIKLQEKEAALVSMEKGFESKLLNEQEKRTKQLKEAKEEQQSLMDRLDSANNTISSLGQELKNDNRLIEQLKVQIDSLQSDLSKAVAEKRSLEQELKEKLDSVYVLQEKINLLSSEIHDKEKIIQELKSSLKKESELKNVNTAYKQTKEELGKAHLEIEGLKEELLRNQSDLESKNSLLDELNERRSSLMVERDNGKQEFDALQEDYNDLKWSAEKKAATDSKLLGEREKEIHQLKNKLDIALNDVNENKAIVAGLKKEREHLKGALEVELDNAKILQEQLQIATGSLVQYRSEASDLSNQLKQSRNHCKELESEVSKVRAEFDETTFRLQSRRDEAKQSREILATELMTTQDLLKKTREELLTLSHELTAVTENRDSLQKELVDVYKKAESVANALNEEKKIVSSLNKELQALEKQIAKDKEARKSLETDLEETTKSLDEMNRKMLKLSGDLESANAKIFGLEDEKMVLYRTLTEQKNASKEAQENMEDAHNLVMTLGKERESLEKRAKKLEEELASAKGEILKLRSQINSSKVPVNDQPQEKDEIPVNDQPQEKDETKAKVTVSERKGTRRRRSNSQ